jgi:hypothetical protein
MILRKYRELRAIPRFFMLNNHYFKSIDKQLNHKTGHEEMALHTGIFA